MDKKFKIKEKYDIDDLVGIMSLLRGEDGCPWDKVQTHESIRSNLIEETYEVTEAIDMKNSEMLEEELGDLLLQVVFHSQLESEKGTFGFDDICDGICKKLIIRHPHIFGSEKLGTPGAVVDRWDEIKKETKNQQTGTEALLAVPKQLPALMRSQKLCKRAEKAGLKGRDGEWVKAELKKELAELEKTETENNLTKAKEKIGKILFLVVCLAKALGLDAEECLFESSEKFINRFCFAEETAKASGRKLSDLSMEEQDALWNEAKAK